MMLYKQLLKRVNDRINNGIGQNGYGDTDSAEYGKGLAFCSFAAFVKKLIKSFSEPHVAISDQNSSRTALLNLKKL